MGHISDGSSKIHKEYGTKTPPSQWHLTELELFRKFKGKPLWEDWVPDWSTVY